MITVPGNSTWDTRQDVRMALTDKWQTDADMGLDGTHRAHLWALVNEGQAETRMTQVGPKERRQWRQK